MKELELFRGIVPFVALAEERSFRKAAQRLGVSPAAVSKSIQVLEAEVGLSLVARSTRAMALTAEGEAFFARCQGAVAAVQGAREALAAARLNLDGELVISLPFLASALVAPGLALLRLRCPRLRLRLVVTDELSRLTEERIDVAVRIGPLADSRLVARPLRRTRLLTVAAPEYLARRGTPRRLDDLLQHDCLSLLGAQGAPRDWLFSTGPQPVPAALLTAHGPGLLDSALAGLGITQLFDYMAEAPLRSGRLIQLFPELTANGPDIHAVCAPGRRITPRVRAAFEALADALHATL